MVRRKGAIIATAGIAVALIGILVWRAEPPAPVKEVQTGAQKACVRNILDRHREAISNHHEFVRMESRKVWKNTAPDKTAADFAQAMADNEYAAKTSAITTYANLCVEYAGCFPDVNTKDKFNSCFRTWNAEPDEGEADEDTGDKWPDR